METNSKIYKVAKDLHAMAIRARSCRVLLAQFFREHRNRGRAPTPACHTLMDRCKETKHLLRMKFPEHVEHNSNAATYGDIAVGVLVATLAEPTNGVVLINGVPIDLSIFV